MDDDEQYSRSNPIEVKEHDIFLHGTSSKKYACIELSGFLLREVSNRNWEHSPKGVCFEKYVKGKNDVVVEVVTKYCRVACEADHSQEGIILQITGRDLKKLETPILADWNLGLPIKHNEEWIPIGIDSDTPILSIVVECDIPAKYLTILKKVPLSRM